MEPPAKRFRFTIEVDIYMLREVREQDPYHNPALWLNVAENLSVALGRPISARAIRERCDLLLAQFAQEDRANLRKSGTEEQYGEKETLLQEIFDVARSHGYRIRPGVARKAASTSASSSQAPSGVDRAERRVASAVRDSASATLHAEPASGEDSTGFGDQDPPTCVRSTSVFDNVEVVTTAPEEPYEVVGDFSQSSPAPQEETTPSTAPVAAGGAAQAVGASAAAGAARARRGRRRRTADRHLEFFERHLALEAETRERAAAQEDRRLQLEERRLDLQERELQQRVREFNDVHEERRQERAMIFQQNRLLADVLQTLVNKLQ
ncbi:hypothetical protein HPB52_000123 [Rhipicephalus sanguineus]|uniref:Uncharacterized protein n=1 Tax=Rhipicephalus sanguineus TaxID=34632 RepID=A0A9D4T126_RHISA|nr:hypothetical protein HPB52_000123 [Rhipicephalus sanguineus]